MDQPAFVCPKCHSAMVLGYLLEGSWVKGAPTVPAVVKAVSWELFKFPWEKVYVPIGSYRCESCGFLESYARDDFAAE